MEGMRDMEKEVVLFFISIKASFKTNEWLVAKIPLVKGKMLKLSLVFQRRTFLFCKKYGRDDLCKGSGLLEQEN